MVKIYSDDPLVHYKFSTIDPMRTKLEIDMLLYQYKAEDVWWHFTPEKNEVWVRFKINEVIEGIPVTVAVKLDCPIIWDRASPRSRPPRPEQINWRVGMRGLHYCIKSLLDMAWVMQSDKVTAFLGYVQGSSGKTLREVIIPKLGEMGFKALAYAAEKEEAQKAT